MAKQINYPTQEWLDNWMDKYMEKHPDERIEDFKALEEDAMYEWWCKEVDKGNPTPNDLTPEQQKEASKASRAKSDKERKKPTERKPRTIKENPDKRAVIRLLSGALQDAHHDEDAPWGGIENVTIVKPEREITFTLNSVSYSMTLIAHRAPKEGA